jgi:predicted enzyme related to lactoylglutathione lyase
LRYAFGNFRPQAACGPGELSGTLVRRLQPAEWPARVGVQAKENAVKRVTGIGGIFFQAQDPAALRAWYKAHLGIDVQGWGGTAFAWADDAGKPVTGSTVWSIAAAGSSQFAPGKAPFMINYRVDDLAALLAALRAEGCNVLEKMDDSEYGKFGWVIDPEGNKVELWQPPPGQ